MTDFFIESIKRSDKKLTKAVRQLGSYEALINYLIDSIRGRTASTPEQAANYVENRQNELLDEQYEIIFNRKRESTCIK